MGFTITVLVLLLAFGEPVGRWVTTEFPHLPFWPRTSGQLILLVFDFLVGGCLAVAVHEAAHLIVGMCVGFGLHSFRIGWLQFDRRFRISLFRGRSTLASGRAEFVPVQTNALALRMAAVTLAGPAANLLTGFTVLLLPFSMGPLSSMFVLSSLFIGFLNLLPLQKGAELTDGRRVLRLLRSRGFTERLVALVKLKSESKGGVLMEDLSPDLVAKAIAIKDSSPETVMAYACAYAAADSRGDDAKAAEYLETCLCYSPYAPLRIQQAFMSDAGVFQARRRKRVDLAEQWMAALPGKTEIPWLRANVEAAILEAKGDIEGALKQLGAIEKVVLAVPDQAYRERQHRSLFRWKSELLSKVAGTIVCHQNSSVGAPPTEK